MAFETFAESFLNKLEACRYDGLFVLDATSAVDEEL
jgi:hypothetical protein